MKKFFLMLLAGVMFIWSGSVLAYTIDDTVNVGKGNTHKSESDPLSWLDYIGANFDTKGIDVNMSGSNIIITMYTKFDGLYTYSGDDFTAADLGLDLNLDGTYEYGVVLTHGTGGHQDYSAALYKDGTWKSSYDVWEGNTTANMEYGEFYPEPSSNREAWVKMVGGTEKGDVTINISSDSGLWKWTLIIDKGQFDSGDLDNQMGIFWATGTCANDVVQGAVVPIPTTILLLGSGLLGFGLLGRRRKI
ncbi:MAG TPA: hypothetical protein ENI35_04355 [Candidatus Desulfofervidus auxilii]|uniref:PEP-CTERM sorting domain-containing protein n=1 Tax=Desulfofervidus auxilii TaxID=1621989 RepID=A0A7C1VLF7_DESA2|nr:hypothetical protein [Candidatus Desulfofervidus auxilii]